jgi:nucleotide-binding universal stress UspA family protein
MQKILCPVDFSETSKNALHYAPGFAKVWGTKVDLIQVYHPESRDAASVPYHEVDALLEARKQQVDQAFVQFTADVDKQFLGHFFKAYGIFTGLEISDVTRDGDYALVVVGTKGDRNSFEQLLGSVTTDLMTRSHCPVMAIPAGTTFEPVHTVAYAVDADAFDPEHGTTTPPDGLLSFTAHTGTKLHVVHVAADYPLQAATYAVIHDDSVMEGVEASIECHAIQVPAMYVPKRRLWERLFPQKQNPRYGFSWLKYNIPCS